MPGSGAVCAKLLPFPHDYVFYLRVAQRRANVHTADMLIDQASGFPLCNAQARW